MEQHEIDTFIAMARRQYADSPKGGDYWVEEAMKFAYELGVEHGQGTAREPWWHDDDIPF